MLAGEPGAPFEVTGRAFAGEPVEFAVRDAALRPRLRRRSRRRSTGRSCSTSTRAASGSRPRASSCRAAATTALERIWIDRARRGRRHRVRRRRPRRAVREPRRRRDVRAQPRAATTIPAAPELAARRGRALPALDRAVARRAGPARGRDLRRRRVADRRRRRELAARQRRPRRALPARRGAGRTRSRCACTGSQRAPARPERIFMQFHGGVYRSDDAGATWTSIADGLPSDFGFPLAIDPADPDSAYVIPLVADVDRVTPDGRVRVYETRDAGASWRPRGDGLPVRGRLPHGAARGVRPARRRARRSSCTSARRRAPCTAPATRARRWFEVARAPPAGAVGQRVLSAVARAARSGISTVTAVPPPGGESTSSWPSSASTRSRRPCSPVPSGFAPPTPSSRTCSRRQLVLEREVDPGAAGAARAWRRW